MRFVGHKIRSLAIWALIPLSLLSGTPLVGCVCANGQHKYLCQWRNAETSDSTVTTSRSCCHPNSRHVASGHARRSCCGRITRSFTGGSGPAVSTRCCQSVLEIPTPSVVGEKSIVRDNDVSSVCVAPVVHSLGQTNPLGVFQVDSLGDLPPPDFVILHHAFLI